MTNKTQVIAYDDKGGGLAAARLWWMLRWVGHDAVAVLDGGWQGWVGKPYPVESGPPRLSHPETRGFQPRVRPEMLVTAEDVYNARGYYSQLLIVDSRAEERFRGDTEPIDPVAGHIPWAINFPFTGTQSPEGFFYSGEVLKNSFEDMNIHGPDVAFYCGSGVTAAANVLALKHAGLGEGKLYAGSWSEWIANPSRPTAYPQTYTHPVDQLLPMGEAPAHKHPWPNYLDLGLTAAHIPDLIRMAKDYNLNWSPGDRPEVFAPLHAWRALGQLRAEEAIEPLLELFHELEDSDWAGEELPVVYSLIGPAAISSLKGYLQDASHSLYPRTTAISALGKIGNAHPASREVCISVLVQQLERFHEQDEELNAFLVGGLVDLKAVEATSVMARAFEADKVEPSIQGDWEDVQIELGLLEARQTPQLHYGMPWLMPDDNEPATVSRFIFAPPQNPKKDKTKRKQAKQARKVNRKKKKEK